MAVGPNGYLDLCEDIRLDLLELYGRGYVIDHCIAALLRKQKKEAKETLFRMYVTDALKVIAENTSHFLIRGVGAVDYGVTMSKRWVEMELPQPEEKKPTRPNAEDDPRPCWEIATEMWTRIRGEKNGAG